MTSPHDLPRSSHSGHVWQQAQRLTRLMRKELRETLRDRRTIGTLLLMPILVYPLLSITFQRFLLSNLQPQAPAGIALAFDSEEDVLVMQRHLALAAQLLDREQRGNLPGVEAGVVRDVAGHVAGLRVDLGVRIERVARENGGRERRHYRYELLYRKNSLSSIQALHFVESQLQRLNQALLRERLARLDASPANDIQVATEYIRADNTSNFSLATLVPLILILMTITGAVYPAIDLTAGERERGTLELLVAAPVSRVALLLAKYTAALTVAILTATVNLVAMSVTLYFTGLLPLLFGEQGLSILVIAQVFGLMVLFAAFFAAVLLVLTSFARSFKEAQAYLIPLMVISIAPGLLSLMPGLQLNSILSVTPLVNIVLLARDVFEGTVAALPAVTAVASTVMYAAAAIGVAARLFGTDTILYAEQGTWSTLLRRPAAPQPTPSLANALFCLAVIFPFYFVLSHLLARWHDVSISLRLTVAAALTAFLFAGIPLLIALRSRVRIISGFRLHAAPALSFVASGCLGLSLWPFAHELFLANRLLGFELLAPETVSRAKSLLEAWQSIPAWWVVLALGIAPGVCEEWFFRGYLLAALRERLPAWQGILIAAALFGLFHVVTPTVLAVERFLPSTFLGIVLGWVALRCGSVLPSMLLHAVHNSLLLLVSYYSEELTQFAWARGVQSETHLPWLWLGIALAVSIASIALLHLRGSGQPASGRALDAELDKTEHLGSEI